MFLVGMVVVIVIFGRLNVVVVFMLYFSVVVGLVLRNGVVRIKSSRVLWLVMLGFFEIGWVILICDDCNILVSFS